MREARDLSLRELAEGARVDRRWLARVERGEANLTLDALAALATVLGAEASVRLYAATGPRLRDHLQVQLLDALLGQLHPRWSPRLEVPVHRPARGVIDLVLVERDLAQVVSGEAHSQIRRAERLLRWSAEKTASIPSAEGWPWTAGEAEVRRLLILRSTRDTRAVVAGAEALFRAAYPGPTRDGIAALTGPGERRAADTLVWVDLRGRATRLLEGAPRGVMLGR